MDEKLEKLMLDEYKELQKYKKEQELELERVKMRISEIECILEWLGLKFETDTIIIKEK